MHQWQPNPTFFKKNFGGHKSFGTADTPVSTFTDVSSGFSVCSLVLGRGIHFICSMRVAFSVLTSWWPPWQLSHSLPCTCEQALVGLETMIYRAADENSTDSAIPTWLTKSNFLIMLNWNRQTKSRHTCINGKQKQRCKDKEIEKRNRQTKKMSSFFFWINESELRICKFDDT